MERAGRRCPVTLTGLPNRGIRIEKGPGADYRLARFNPVQARANQRLGGDPARGNEPCALARREPLKGCHRFATRSSEHGDDTG